MERHGTQCRQPRELPGRPRAPSGCASSNPLQLVRVFQCRLPMNSKPRFAIAILFFACAAAVLAADPRSDQIDKSFKASDGGQLIIDTDRGSLVVEGQESEEVRVTVSRKVTKGSDSAAAELLKDHQVEITQVGNEVRVRCDLPAKYEGWSFGSPQLQVEIRAQVPKRFNVEAQTAGGSVATRQLKGTVVMKTSGGSLTAEKIDGSLQAKTSGGSIRGSNLAGQVDFNTSGGNISVDGVSGTGFKASTSGGSIHLSDVSVPADVKTSGGSIEIQGAAGPLSASTSGGSVRADFSGAPKGDVVLKTSAGGISVGLPANSAVALDASTSAGSVRSDFEVSGDNDGKKDRSSLKGAINGGGPALKLRTSAGSIKIKRL